jgi:DNA modification methylase
MKIENVKLSQIKANKSNPRVIKDHKFHKLVKSLLVLPKMLELRPIVVSSDMTILGGNMRFRALQHIAKLPEDERIKILESSNDYNIKKDSDKEKLKVYWNVFCDSPIVPIVKANELSDAEQKEFIIKDNASFGEWDFDCLANEWDVADLNDWGIDLPTFDIDEGEEEREIIEDEVPEVEDKAEPICKKGDIWQLGRHRLMCGSSLAQADIDKLLDGTKCELTFTYPPYQLETQGGGIFKKANNMKQIKQNGVDTFDPSMLIIQSETNIYCHNKPLIKKYIELAEANNQPYDLCFYKKLCTVPNYKGHMMTDCEYIAIIGKQDPNKGLPKETYSKCYIGKKDHDNELSYSKPVELCAKYIRLYGKKNILDLFGGSGSTLIACEQLDRTCYMMEIDPKYCDVIIARWEKLTNQKATKIN